MKRTCQTAVPMDAEGNMHPYPLLHCPLTPVQPFEGELRFTGFVRGRTAAQAVMVDTTSGKRYPMFLSMFAEAMPHVQGGVLRGRFGYVKKGANFCLYRMEDAA